MNRARYYVTGKLQQTLADPDGRGESGLIVLCDPCAKTLHKDTELWPVKPHDYGDTDYWHAEDMEAHDTEPCARCDHYASRISKGETA